MESENPFFRLGLALHLNATPFRQDRTGILRKKGGQERFWRFRQFFADGRDCSGLAQLCDLAVSGEENPTRKGVSGQRWGLKEAIGSHAELSERSVSELDSAGCRREHAKGCEARYGNYCNKCLETQSTDRESAQ